MPGGKPVWHGNLGNTKFEDLFGFIKAYIECPDTLNKPFLPARDYGDDDDMDMVNKVKSSKSRDSSQSILLFPTGQWVGVYFTEELKYAEKLGYIVKPICGYTYDRMKTPFSGYVNSFYDKRLEAKKEGPAGDGVSMYKTILNCLYVV